jgi:hypothetical protein
MGLSKNRVKRDATDPKNWNCRNDMPKLDPYSSEKKRTKRTPRPLPPYPPLSAGTAPNHAPARGSSS